MEIKSVVRSNSNRIAWIDIAKAIGVVLVVLGHTGLPEVFRKWIYEFHMPLFFFISGMFFKPLDVVPHLKKKFKAYIIPYLAFSAVFMVLNQILEPGMERFTADFIRVVTLKGAFPVLWFLAALFIIDVIYNLANRYINSDRGFLFGISIALCLIANVSNICQVPNYLIWQSICEGMVFYAFGAYMKAPNNVVRSFSIPACLATGIVTIIFAVTSTGFPISVVDISQGQIGIPF